MFFILIAVYYFESFLFLVIYLFVSFCDPQYHCRREDEPQYLNDSFLHTSEPPAEPQLVRNAHGKLCRRMLIDDIEVEVPLPSLPKRRGVSARALQKQLKQRQVYEQLYNEVYAAEDEVAAIAAKPSQDNLSQDQNEGQGEDEGPGQGDQEVGAAVAVAEEEDYSVAMVSTSEPVLNKEALNEEKPLISENY